MMRQGAAGSMELASAGADVAPAARTWSAASNWAAADGSSIDAAVCFETTAEDAVPASVDGVLLNRPVVGGGDDPPPCEVTVSFGGKHEIHRVYVRSTARVYEIYYTTSMKSCSKEYLCTVRCCAAVEDDQLSEKTVKYRSDEGLSDEDGWVQVKVPDSPLENAGMKLNESGSINQQVHFEATAEISDVSPCVSVTIRLLSIQAKTSVHIDEIYIYADPVQSTRSDDDVSSQSMAGSSLFAMLVPSLLQMSKSRSLAMDDRLSRDSGAQGIQGYGLNMQSRDKTNVEGPSHEQDGALNIVQQPQNAENPTDNQDGRSTIVQEKVDVEHPSVEKEIDLHEDLRKKASCSVLSSPESGSLMGEMRKDIDISSLSNEKATDQTLKADPIDERVNSHVEMMLSMLLTKVERVETYCSKFEDSVMKPLGLIETRLQQLENQFTSFGKDIQALKEASPSWSDARLSRDTENSDNAGAEESFGPPARSQGLLFRAPEVTTDRFSANLRGVNNKASTCKPKKTSGFRMRVPSWSDDSSESEQTTTPGFVIKAPELHGQDYFPPTDSLDTPASVCKPNLPFRFTDMAPDFIHDESCQNDTVGNPVPVCEPNISSGSLVDKPEFTIDGSLIFPSVSNGLCACESEMKSGAVFGPPDHSGGEGPEVIQLCAFFSSPYSSQPMMDPLIDVEMPYFPHNISNKELPVSAAEEPMQSFVSKCGNDPTLVFRAPGHCNEYLKSDGGIRADAAHNLKSRKPLAVDVDLASALAAFVASAKYSVQDNYVQAGSFVSVQDNKTDVPSSFDESGHLSATLIEKENDVLLARSDIDAAVSDALHGKPHVCDESSNELEAKFSVAHIRSESLQHIVQPSEPVTQFPRETDVIDCCNDDSEDEGGKTIEPTPSFLLADYLASKNVDMYKCQPDLMGFSYLDSGRQYVGPSPGHSEGIPELSQEHKSGPGVDLTSDITQLVRGVELNDENNSQKPTSRISNALVSDDKFVMDYCDGYILNPSLDKQGSIFCDKCTVPASNPGFGRVNRCWTSNSDSDMSIDEVLSMTRAPALWSDYSSAQSLATSVGADMDGDVRQPAGSSSEINDMDCQPTQFNYDLRRALYSLMHLEGGYSVNTAAQEMERKGDTELANDIHEKANGSPVNRQQDDA